MEKFNLLNRFLKYVSYETTSDETSGCHPSSAKEIILSKAIKDEMEQIGLVDVTLSDKGYLYGHLEKNSDNFKTIGFISHVDTAPDFSGKDVKPQIHYNYDGETVCLNKELGIYLDSKEYSFLKNLKGRTLITTDGTTLLGADDKSGVSEIMALIEYLNNHQEIKHGDIYVSFTPDEEIGEGPMFFENDLFKVDYAYTVDGDEEGEIAYENFNAASCVVNINGKNIHPGSAKDHMVNSILISMEFNSMLDPNEVPAKTEMYEGFNHLNGITGDVSNTKMYYIIRNHSKEIFNRQKQDFVNIAKKLNEKYGEGTVNVTLKDSYYNMFEIVKDHMEVVDVAKKAIMDAGITPRTSPIRGGTDGATLTFRGIICPNLGTGGYNFHGKYECITLEGMEKATEILLNIVKNSTK